MISQLWFLSSRKTSCFINHSRRDLETVSSSEEDDSDKEECKKSGATDDQIKKLKDFVDQLVYQQYYIMFYILGPLKNYVTPLLIEVLWFQTPLLLSNANRNAIYRCIYWPIMLLNVSSNHSLIQGFLSFEVAFLSCLRSRLIRIFLFLSHC